MAEPTTIEDDIKRAREQRAARLAAQQGTPAPAAPPPPAATPATIEDDIRRAREQRAARAKPVAAEPVTPPAAPAPRPQKAQEVKKTPAPKPPKAQETKKTEVTLPAGTLTVKPQPAQEAPQRGNDEALKQKIRADVAGPGSEKEHKDAAAEQEAATSPLVRAVTTAANLNPIARKMFEGLTGEEPTAENVAREMRLQTEGLREAVGGVSQLGEQGANVARVVASDTALRKMADPRVVGAAAVAPALEPVRRTARAAVKQELADAERDYAMAAERAEKEALAKREAEKVTPAPGDLTAARRLADTLRMETADRKYNDTLAKRYLDKRVIELENEWRIDQEKDPEKVAEARKKAQDTALAELVALNTEGGYGIPIGRDVLFGSDSAWTALLPAREVLPSGKVARGESLPGWFLNVVLGAPDYGVTTLKQAMDENRTPSLDDLAKNVGDRRDLLAYTIEQDPELQADIASGDPRRVNRAILALAPYAVVEMATPDVVSAAGGAVKFAKLPGSAAKAVRVVQEAGRLMRAEERLSPVLALQRAALKVEQAEEAARAAKKAAKAADRSRRTLGAVADAVERGDALDALPETAAVRIRDDVAARLSVDPEVQAFLNDTGAAGRPLTPEVADLPSHRRIDDPLREASERGRAKYAVALDEAEAAARADFVKQARLAPGEAIDATRVVDVGADDARKAALAAEEARLRRTRELAETERALPETNARLQASREIAAEARKIEDGTHPALQKMRKAAEAVVDDFELPAFMRKERARIEEALAKLDAGDAATAAPTIPSTIRRQEEALAADQHILDANRGMGREARARRQAVLDKRAEGLERQKAALPPPQKKAPSAASAKKRAQLDADMKAYLAQEAYLRRAHEGERAEALASLRAARDEARAVVDRVEMERARLGTPEGKTRAPDPERLAELEAQIARREGRIAGMQDVPMREVFAERTFDHLVAEIAQINRDLDTARKMSPANLRWRVRKFASGLAENIWDYLHPARDREHKSLRDLWRALVRDFEGEIKGINERLAASFADVRLDSEEWSRGAREVLADYAVPFRESVRGGGVDGAHLGAAATAYLRDPSLLDHNSLRLLTDVVVRWAREGEGDLDALRTELRAVSARLGVQARAAQEGDVMLANAVASQGAAHRLLVGADARGLTLGAEEAHAANTYLDNLNGTGPVGGRAEASRGRQVMANLLVPEDYRRPLDWTERTRTEHVAQPFVPGRTEQARGVKMSKADKQAQVLREAAVASMAQVMEHTEEVLGKNVFVPRAVRDALAKQVEAVIATARIHDDGGTLLLRNFWKQAAVLGVFTSQPQQTVMDFWSDVLAVNAHLRGGPIAAAKVAGRSAAAQVLATRFVAQGTRIADALAPRIARVMEKSGFKGRFVDWLRDAKAGDTARAFIARTSLTPEIDAIFNRDPSVKIGAHTAQEVHDIFRREGVFESFSSGQLTRTVQEAAYYIFGDTPFGKAKAAYFENQRALQDLANLSATRRRLAIGYGLVETGHTPEEAARIAVEIAGDFAGELHPIERGWFSTVFPFWSYRKFNARRTLSMLRNPFWLTRGLKAQEGAAAALSWYLDDSDEYGFHTESMYDEPDPEALDALRAQVHEETGLDMASAEAEAIVAERADELPRAIERYERLVAKLRALPYDEAREAYRVDPEWAWLAPYHAPDPVRDMLPGWAQDRYAVFVQENRNQAVESWYRKGVGRYEREGGEQRYWLMPNDPHIDGLAEVAAVTAIASVAAASLLQDDVDFARYNRSTLLDAVFRDPLMYMMISAGSSAGGTTAEEKQRGKVVPDGYGAMLERLGLAQLVVEQDRGEDVTQAPETKRGAKYVVPPEVLASASLLPLVAPALLGTMELAIVGQRVSGDNGKAGPKDTLDKVAAFTEGLVGQKLGTTDPSTEGYIGGKAADERVDAAVKKLGSQKALRATDDVLKVRDVRSALKSQTAAEEVRRARARLAGRQLLDPLDIGALRAELVRQGMAEDEAIRLSDMEVIAKFRAMR